MALHARVEADSIAMIGYQIYEVVEMEVFAWSQRHGRDVRCLSPERVARSNIFDGLIEALVTYRRIEIICPDEQLELWLVQETRNITTLIERIDP